MQLLSVLLERSYGYGKNSTEPSDIEDMAYKNNDQRIDITNMLSQKNRIRK
jgi:hypothetical protein